MWIHVAWARPKVVILGRSRKFISSSQLNTKSLSHGHPVIHDHPWLRWSRMIWDTAVFLRKPRVGPKVSPIWRFLAPACHPGCVARMMCSSFWSTCWVEMCKDVPWSGFSRLVFRKGHSFLGGIVCVDGRRPNSDQEIRQTVIPFYVLNPERNIHKIFETTN